MIRFVTIFWIVGLLGLCLGTSTVHAQGLAEEIPRPILRPTIKTPRGGTVKREDIVIPADATPEQLIDLMNSGDTIAQGREDLAFREQVKIWVYLVLTAAERVLDAPAATDDQKQTASRAKFIILYQGSRVLPHEMEPLARPLFESILADDPNSEFAAPAAAMLFNFRYLVPDQLPAGAVPAIESLRNQYANSSMILALFPQLARSLEEAGKMNEARTLLEETLEELKDSDVEVLETLRQELASMKVVGTQVELSGPTLAGTDYNLVSDRGKVVLVVFWATWEEESVEALPRFQKLFAEYHPQGLEVVGVSLDDDRNALRAFLRQNQIEWPQVFFPEQVESAESPLAKKLGVRQIPAVFLIDKQGFVLSRSLLSAGALEAKVRDALGLPPKMME
jgi:thiol-disulfide isomerase/thioredoxin